MEEKCYRVRLRRRTPLRGDLMRLSYIPMYLFEQPIRPSIGIARSCYLSLQSAVCLLLVAVLDK